MSSFLNKIKQVIFGKEDSKNIVESLASFNEATHSYINLLENNLRKKQEKVSRIRLMVQKIKRKPNPIRSQINIQLVDINNTKVTERGKGAYSKKMDWEKNISDFSNKKGKIV